MWTQMLEVLPSATVISQPRLLSQALECARGSVVSAHVTMHTPLPVALIPYILVVMACRLDEEGKLSLIQKVTAVATEETRAKRPTEGVVLEAFLVLPPELLDAMAAAFPTTPWIYVLR